MRKGCSYQAGDDFKYLLQLYHHCPLERRCAFQSPLGKTEPSLQPSPLELRKCPTATLPLRKTRLTWLPFPTILSFFILETKVLNIWLGPTAIPSVSGVPFLIPKTRLPNPSLCGNSFQVSKTSLQPCPMAFVQPLVTTTSTAHDQASQPTFGLIRSPDSHDAAQVHLTCLTSSSLCLPGLCHPRLFLRFRQLPGFTYPS